MAPLGMRVMMHEKTEHGETWGPHAGEEYYIGISIHHYIFYKVWIMEIRADMISDTIVWFPSSLTIPIPFSVDLTIATLQKITTALANPYTVSPFAPIANVNMQDLQQLSEILSNTTMPMTLICHTQY